MSLIKFKKCDYYHDRNNKMWIIKIITLTLFIVTGIITCINLYYSKNHSIPKLHKIKRQNYVFCNSA